MNCSKRFVKILWLAGLLLCAAGCTPELAKHSNALTTVVAPTRITAQSPYSVVLEYNRGAIATVQPLATAAAKNAFLAGGNAVDAALAAAFTLGVVDSHNSGIGGGCFILARLANGQILAIDGREVAPAKAHRDMYLVNGEVDNRNSKVGALAVGVPGSVQALYDLQQAGGNLRFADVLLPAADLAEQGFNIDNTLAKRLAATATDIALFEATAKVFLSNGQPLTQGQWLRQADLAASYRHLAEQGPSWFYTGDFAAKTAAWMAANGGLIDQTDFARYTTQRREPVVSHFMGYDIVGFGPPSSGGVHVAQMLNMLAGEPLVTMPDAERYHLLAEVMKLAFADRAHWLGDADFVPVPKGLLDVGYARGLRTLIDMSKAATNVSFHLPPNSSHDFFEQQINQHTTHLTTADAEGNWVAITTTLNTSFGSKVMIPGTGVLLNNQMDDFVAAPNKANAFGLVGGEANSIEPFKRPLSSMSPTLVLKAGEPVMAIGAAGGPTIITQVLQGLVNFLALNDDLFEAINRPRIHHQWQPDWLFTELPLEGAVARSLLQKGHDLKSAGDFGGTQAIAIKNGVFEAVTEPRVVRRNQLAD